MEHVSECIKIKGIDLDKYKTRFPNFSQDKRTFIGKPISLENIKKLKKYLKRI